MIILPSIILAPIIGAAFGVWATSATAGPVAFWGGSSAQLSGCHEADACVTVINRLTGSPDVVDAQLDIEGFAVLIHVVMGKGRDPDRVTITAPVGCLVLPPAADVDEDQVQVFRIYFPKVG